MKAPILKRIFKLVVVLSLILIVPAYADDELPGFDDDVNDEAPIDSLIYCGIAGAVLLGWMMRKKPLYK